MAALDAYIASREALTYDLIAQATDAVRSIDFHKGATGYSYVTLDPKEVNAKIVRPDVDTTPFPVFEAPAVNEPAKPTLVALNNITHPTMPNAPTIDTTGLFNNQKPSGVLPEWNESTPNLHVEEIYNALVALSAPVLESVALPVIRPISIRNAPTIHLPSYSANEMPTELSGPVNYADYFQNKYDAALPELQGFIDHVVDTWISKNAPEFYQQRDAIHAKVLAGLNGEVLSEEFESRLFSRAQARVAEAYAEAENAIADNNARGVGFIIAPGAVTTAMNTAKLAGAKALGGNAQEVWLERRRSEIQHLQYVLNMATANVQNIRNLAIQYAQVGLSINQEARANAEAFTNKLVQIFEHEKSRGEFSLAVLDAIDKQYKTKLTAALSELEGFKTELEALRLTKDVEQQQIEAVKIKLDAKQIEVNNYSAMVDAIAKRTVSDELRIKELDVKSKVFQTTTNSVLATYDLYKAANEGDRSKLQGLMAKIDVYDKQLGAIKTGVDIDVSIQDGRIKTNAAKNDQYNTEARVYETLHDVALKKFTANEAIKRLGMDVYKTNVTTELAIWQGELEKQFKFIDEKLKAFAGNVQSLSEFYRVEQGYSEMGLHQTSAIASGISNVAAAAAANALTGAISLSEQA